MTTRLLTLFTLVAALLSGCASLPPGSEFPKSVTTALEQPEQTWLGRQFSVISSKQAGRSGFRILSTGIDGFLSRAQMIDAAEKTLDLQYYIFRFDDTGQLLADAILRAADRGVRIRVLLDDGDKVPGDEKVLALGAHPRIEIRIYNPFAYRGHRTAIRGAEFLLSAARVDYRMHNKLMVADNAMALVGGRNIGDEYFQIDPQSQFGDDDVFAVGPIVRALSGTFDEFWNSALAIPAQALATGRSATAPLDELRVILSEHRWAKKAAGTDYVAQLASRQPLAGMISGSLPLNWANAQLVYDTPDKKSVVKGDIAGSLMHRRVADAASLVQSELLMVTPYFIPGVGGLQMFKDLRDRGVNVRILTNSLQSNPEILAHVGYTRYRKRLLEDGVALYEVRSLLGNARGSGQTSEMAGYGNYALHAKLFVFDRKRVFIGSMNFDLRSMHINTEVGLLIDSPELARETAARFEAIVRPENSFEVKLVRNEGLLPRLFWLTKEDGKLVQYDTEPARNDSQRLKAQLLYLLPLDNEL